VPEKGKRKGGSSHILNISKYHHSLAPKNWRSAKLNAQIGRLPPFAPFGTGRAVLAASAGETQRPTN